MVNLTMPSLPMIIACAVIAGCFALDLILKRRKHG